MHNFECYAGSCLQAFPSINVPAGTTLNVIQALIYKHFQVKNVPAGTTLNVMQVLAYKHFPVNNCCRHKFECYVSSKSLSTCLMSIYKHFPVKMCLPYSKTLPKKHCCWALGYGKGY